MAALNIGKIEWHDMQSTTSSLRAEMRVIAVLRLESGRANQRTTSTKQTAAAAAAAESEEAPQVTLGGEGFRLQGQQRRGDLGNPPVIPRRRNDLPPTLFSPHLSPTIWCLASFARR